MIQINAANPRIGYDIDGVIADFNHGVFKEAVAFGFDQHGFPVRNEDVVTWDYNGLAEMWGKIWTRIQDNPSFWMGLPPILDAALHADEMTPFCYITARPISHHVTMRWLMEHGFPEAPVYSVPAEMKSRIANDLQLQFFIDDKYETFQQLNLETRTTCFLRNQPYNRHNAANPNLRVDNIPHFHRQIEHILTRF